MLEIFIKFLGDLGLKAFSTIDMPKSENKEHLKKFITLFMSLNRIYNYLCNYHKHLENWRQSDFHGSHWSHCQRTLAEIYNSLKLLKSDVTEIVAIKELGLTNGIMGFLNIRYNVFSIWLNIIGNNAMKNFCSWDSQYSHEVIDGKTYSRNKRTIFIPSYSVLLHDIKSTGELENIKDSYYENEMSISFEDSKSQFECICPKENFNDILLYLPEMSVGNELPVNPGIQIPNSVKEIVLPEEKGEIDEIIRTTGEAIAKLHLVIEILRQTLKDYCVDNSIDIWDSLI